MVETETLTDHLPGKQRDAPDPEWIRGTCPMCDAPLVSNAYYVGGKGYVIYHECWNSLGPVEATTCDYRRVM